MRDHRGQGLARDHGDLVIRWAGKVLTQRILLLMLLFDLGIAVLLNLAAEPRQTVVDRILATLMLGGVVNFSILFMATLGSWGRPQVANPGSAFWRAFGQGAFWAIVGALVAATIAVVIWHVYESNWPHPPNVSREVPDLSGLVIILVAIYAAGIGAIVGLTVGVVRSLRREPGREKSTEAVHRDLDFS